MLRVILSVLGISQIMIMTRDSLNQWKILRRLKKEYLDTLNRSSSGNYADNNDSNHTDSNNNSIDMTATVSLLGEEKFKKGKVEGNNTAVNPIDYTIKTRATTPAMPTVTHYGISQRRQIPFILKEYARLVLEVTTQEIKMINGAKARMQGIASMPMVLCAVGFIPACISSLGILYSESATPIYNDYDQSIVSELLILLAIWCSFSILQTILWYRIVPSYVHRKVAHKLIKKPVANGGKKVRPKIYHQRTLLQLLDDNNNMALGDTSYELLEQYQQEIQNRKLDKKVIRLTNQMIVLQFLYPFHDILSWLTYPVMLLFQIIILYFLWWWPKNDDYNIPMRAQNMYSVWIFVINCILVLSAPSPRDDEDDMEEEIYHNHDPYRHHDPVF